MSSVHLQQPANGINSNISPVEAQNSREELFEWLTSNETPLIYKIGAIALPVILGYVIGTLIGYPLITAVIVTLIPAVLTCIGGLTLRSRRQEVIDQAERDLRRAQEINNAFVAMRNAVGGDAVFNALPVHDIGSRLGSTGYINFLRPEDLAHPAVRGTDSNGRPFISLRLRADSPNAPQEPFVITFHQRHTNDGLWSYGTNAGRIEDANGNPFFSTVITDADRALIRQIVVERNHPHLALAE